MKKFVVIGLGNFGMNIARTLMENECEVLGIDSQKETVQKAKDFCTHAVMGEATNKSVLQSLSLRDFDAAVVSIGQEMSSSILISLYLKEIGVKRIVVRAISEDHYKILEALEVSEIVFPERDMAVRLGKTLSMKNALDYLPLTEEYAIMDVQPPGSWIDKSIRDLQIGAKFGCQILGIKFEYSRHMEDHKVHKTKIAPTANEVIPPDSVLIILGRQADIEKIQNLG